MPDQCKNQFRFWVFPWFPPPWHCRVAHGPHVVVFRRRGLCGRRGGWIGAQHQAWQAKGSIATWWFFLYHLSLCLSFFLPFFLSIYIYVVYLCKRVKYEWNIIPTIIVLTFIIIFVILFILMFIIITTITKYIYIPVPVVLRKAVAQVSRIGRYRMQGWQRETTDGPKGGWSCAFWSGCNGCSGHLTHISWM